MFFMIKNIPELEISPDKKIVLHKLLSSHRDGKNYLWLERKDYLILKQKFKGDSLIEPILYQLYDSINEGVSIKKVLDFYVSIYFDDENDALFKYKEKPCCLELSYKKIKDLEYFDSCICLVSENLTDVNAYLFLANEFKSLTKEISHLSISLEKCSGGGNQTARCFDYKTSEKITLCLVDSDRKYHKCAVKKTALDVQKLDILSSTNKIFKAYTLESHEIENLFPPEIWKKWYSLKSDSDIGVFFDTNILKNASRKDFVKYIDYKKGLKLFDIESHIDSSFKKYWTIFVDLVGRPELEKRNICIALGDQALNNLITTIDNNIDFKKEVQRILHDPTHWYKLWENYARIVCSWAIAPHRSVAS